MLDSFPFVPSILLPNIFNPKTNFPYCTEEIFIFQTGAMMNC